MAEQVAGGMVAFSFVQIRTAQEIISFKHGLVREGGLPVKVQLQQMFLT